VVEPRDERPAVPWRGRDAAYVAIAYVVASFIFGFLFAGAGLGFFVVGVELLLGAITLLWTRLYRSSGLLLGSRFRFGVTSLLAGLGTAALLFATQLVIAFTAVALRGAPPPPGSSNIPDLSGGGMETALLIVAIVALAPLVEELFFRGLLLQGLERSFRRWTAVLVSSVLFALPHIVPTLFGSIVAVLTTFAVGVGLAWVFIWSRNLAIPIVAHAGFNAIALALALAASA
jgi:CAAX protease family protein